MKQALIIGGAGGIGSALVARLFDRGVEVAVGGRTRPRDPRVQRFYEIDAAAADWPSLYRAVESDSGLPLDGVVFVAGTAAYGETALFPAERARAIFELNFWGCCDAAVEIARHWAKANRPGTFVAVLSIVARRAVPFEAYYSASKAAAARFLESLDLEYAASRIRFVPAFPGTLDTLFRQRAPWYGVPPASDGRGAGVRTAARAIDELLQGSRLARVIGWRERVIDLADRFAPGFYDWAVLRRRVANARRPGKIARGESAQRK